MSGSTVGLQWVYSGSTTKKKRRKDGASRTGRWGKDEGRTNV